MQNLDIVQRFQSLNYLYKNAPDLVFLEICLFLLVLCYFLEQVSVVRVLHHDAIKVSKLGYVPK